MSVEYALLAGTFGLVTALCVFPLLQKAKSSLLMAFSICHVILFYGLWIQDYSLHESLVTLVAAHLLLLAYFAAVVLGSVDCVHLRGKEWLAGALQIRWVTLLSVQMLWFGWKIYLIKTYGLAGMAATRALEGPGPSPFSAWESAVSSFIGALFVGAVVCAIVSHSAGRRFPGWVVLAGGTLFLLYLMAGEASSGARRLMLGLAALWVAVRYAAYKGLGSFIRKEGACLLLLIACVGASTLLYQRVRGWPADPWLVESIASGELGSLARRAVSTQLEEAEWWRSGPLDFFASVVGAVQEGKSSGGEATWFSIVLSIPRVLLGDDKPVGDVDDILLERLGIVPAGPYVAVDYSTSLPAIAIADFGLSGIFLASLLLILLFRAYSVALVRTRRYELVYLLVLGTTLQLVTSQEAGLTAFLAGFRDLVMFSLSVGFFHAASASLRRLLRRGARRGQRGIYSEGAGEARGS